MTAPLRRALDRLATGTPTVLWRIAAWPGAGATWQARCGRCAWAAFCSWSTWQIVQHSHPAMALTVAWLLTAGWRAGRSTTPPPPAVDTPPDDEKAGHSTADEEPHTLGEGFRIMPHPDGNPNHWSVDR